MKTGSLEARDRFEKIFQIVVGHRATRVLRGRPLRPRHAEFNALSALVTFASANKPFP